MLVMVEQTCIISDVQRDTLWDKYSKLRITCVSCSCGTGTVTETLLGSSKAGNCNRIWVVPVMMHNLGNNTSGDTFLSTNDLMDRKN